jgi:hypothetical protein
MYVRSKLVLLVPFQRFVLMDVMSLQGALQGRDQ